jgi:hypothetical protein
MRKDEKTSFSRDLRWQHLPYNEWSGSRKCKWFWLYSKICSHQKSTSKKQWSCKKWQEYQRNTKPSGIKKLRSDRSLQVTCRPISELNFRHENFQLLTPKTIRRGFTVHLTHHNLKPIISELVLVMTVRIWTDPRLNVSLSSYDVKSTQLPYRVGVQQTFHDSSGERTSWSRCRTSCPYESPFKMKSRAREIISYAFTIWN